MKRLLRAAAPAALSVLALTACVPWHPPAAGPTATSAPPPHPTTTTGVPEPTTSVPTTTTTPVPQPDWVARAVGREGEVLFDDAAEEAALDRIVGDARLIMGGEASHGVSEFFTAKVQLAADQLERGGLTDVFLEDPVPDTAAAARYVALGEGTAEDAARAFAFDWWRTREFVDLLELLRAHNVEAERTGGEPAFFLGMDVQGSPGDFTSALTGYLAVADPEEAERVGGQLACFDSDEDAAGYLELPAEERAACRAALEGVRAGFAARAAEIADRPRVPADVELHLAHAAAEALLWVEGSTALGEVGFSEGNDFRDRGMAAVTEAVFERDADAKALVSLHDIHAGTFRGVPLPFDAGEEVTITSTGAVLADRLGDDAVATLGFTLGEGSFNAYDQQDPFNRITEFPTGPPPAGSYEAEFEADGPDAPAFVLPLDEGVESLAAPRPARIAYTGGWDRETSDPVVTASLPELFDGVVHYREVTPSVLLDEQIDPTITIDGAPAPITGGCGSPEAVEGTFDGGSFVVGFDTSDPDTARLTVTTADGVVSTGTGPLVIVRGGYEIGADLTAPDGTTLRVDIASLFPAVPCEEG